MVGIGVPTRGVTDQCTYLGEHLRDLAQRLHQQFLQARVAGGNRAADLGERQHIQDKGAQIAHGRMGMRRQAHQTRRGALQLVGVGGVLSASHGTTVPIRWASQRR
jgi:hypothetical protein